MTKKLESKGSRYALTAVIISIALCLIAVFLLSANTNPAVVSPLLQLYNEIPVPITTGIISLFMSAHYFGKKAGAQLEKDRRFGSFIGLTTALQVLVVTALTLSLSVVLQLVWNDTTFYFWMTTFLALRIFIALLLLGIPFVLLIGYGFGMLLNNELSNKP